MTYDSPTDGEDGGTIEENNPYEQLVEVGLDAVTDIELQLPGERVQLGSIRHYEPTTSYHERTRPAPKGFPGEYWVTSSPEPRLDADIEVPGSGEDEAKSIHDAHIDGVKVALVYTIEGGGEIVFDNWLINGIHHSHDVDYSNGLIQVEAEQLYTDEFDFRPDWTLTNPGHPNTSPPYHHNGEL